MSFCDQGRLLGARIDTYLLEKSRLCVHGEGERNFHVFYQLLCGATDEHMKKFGFDDPSLDGLDGLELANEFQYTCQGGAPELREWNDEKAFERTLIAMENIDWTKQKVDKVLSVVAGLLHLGEIQFSRVERDTGEEMADIVVEFEKEDRPKTEWFGGIDAHHIFFEGMHKNKDNSYTIHWGS